MGEKISHKSNMIQDPSWTEDGGQAKILEIPLDHPNLFIRLHSWNDSERGIAPEHPALDFFEKMVMGKKIKITFEIIEEKGN